ncbi:MAG: hypothetical protein EOO72_03185 [Myxococcaceae bacterium]|nr:MAG: hypothetical protein EOO72_03185 [Myxococcaceae bacterium]
MGPRAEAGGLGLPVPTGQLHHSGDGVADGTFRISRRHEIERVTRPQPGLTQEMVRHDAAATFLQQSGCLFRVAIHPLEIEKRITASERLTGIDADDDHVVLTNDGSLVGAAGQILPETRLLDDDRQASGHTLEVRDLRSGFAIKTLRAKRDQGIRSPGARHEAAQHGVPPHLNADEESQPDAECDGGGDRASEAAGNLAAQELHRHTRQASHQGAADTVHREHRRRCEKNEPGCQRGHTEEQIENERSIIAMPHAVGQQRIDGHESNPESGGFP